MGYEPDTRGYRKTTIAPPPSAAVLFWRKVREIVLAILILLFARLLMVHSGVSFVYIPYVDPFLYYVLGHLEVVLKFVSDFWSGVRLPTFDIGKY
ncbi:MAG: hypothetical protein K1X83_06130 [Oligoflexia bacterium]|nr:hypothetical protein [Oligoflexia bacterium]